MVQIREARGIRQAEARGYPVGAADDAPGCGAEPVLPEWLATAGCTGTKAKEAAEMGRHFVSYEAQCPFYRAEDRKVIYCEGVEQGSGIRNAFAGSAAPYKARYCCAGWEDCLIARMLWSKYD